MVDLVKPCRIGILFVVALIGSARAQGLPDPTRPPLVGAAGQEADAARGMPQAPQLRSIILRPGARPRALIDGEWVEQGREYAGSRVLKITANAVEMMGPQGPEVLRLTPEVEIQPAQSAGGKMGRTSNKTGKQE